VMNSDIDVCSWWDKSTLGAEVLEIDKEQLCWTTTWFTSVSPSALDLRLPWVFKGGVCWIFRHHDPGSEKSWFSPWQCHHSLETAERCFGSQRGL